jgi:DNA primase (bacterial type)
MDLISLYQIGIKNVVATLGTALTKEHANLLKKYIKEAIVMFDSDEAGKKAAIRAAEILLSEGITVRYAYYTEAKDPDELSKKV